jgi:hypothetical protein
MAAQNFTFSAARYRAGVAGTTTQWLYQRFDTTNPYTENNGAMAFDYINATTIRVRVRMTDADVGDQTGVGPAVDEPVSIDITAGLNYRKSINEVTVESYLPSYTVSAWTLYA